MIWMIILNLALWHQMNNPQVLQFLYFYPFFYLVLLQEAFFIFIKKKQENRGSIFRGIRFITPAYGQQGKLGERSPAMIQVLRTYNQESCLVFKIIKNLNLSTHILI
ncbi:uncharacterized protein LOC113370782 [Ctenocephalides felis]|uniref:uncharacterized protein LOC113370782 n=1 Tax=Ctenocephalides felis TaxID=7515 RepID=UPI000E6E174E|nr:uncharacterized protein LOC113370782 [Ctenocephalides felis]